MCHPPFRSPRCIPSVEIGKITEVASDKILARRYFVSGRVQGVGYRAFAQRCAQEIGVSGWARNLADGRVEVHANGASHNLELFEARLRQGPRWGEVQTLQVYDASSEKAVDFRIRY